MSCTLLPPASSLLGVATRHQPVKVLSSSNIPSVSKIGEDFETLFPCGESNNFVVPPSPLPVKNAVMFRTIQYETGKNMPLLAPPPPEHQPFSRAGPPAP